MMHVASMRCFVDQDGESLSTKRLVPEAVAFKCQSETIIAAPVGQEPADFWVKRRWHISARP